MEKRGKNIVFNRKNVKALWLRRLEMEISSSTQEFKIKEI